jgi:hypothetical protein
MMGDKVIVDGKACTEDEIRLASQYMGRLRASGITEPKGMILWAQKELAKPDGKRPLR